MSIVVRQAGVTNKLSI